MTNINEKLLECYSNMLQSESDYMLSENVLAENIIANEYTFTSNGKRFG